MFVIIRRLCLSSRRLLELKDIDTRDAYSMFKIQPRYAINVSELKRDWIKLMHILHPDKHVDGGQHEIDRADGLSAIANRYYDILKSPYLRGKHLLALETGKGEEEIEENLDNLEIDAQFLARIMETREKIDQPDLDQQERRNMAADIKMQINSLTVEIEKQFNAKDYDGVLRNLGKAKFLANCYKCVEDYLEDDL